MASVHSKLAPRQKREWQGGTVEENVLNPWQPGSRERETERKRKTERKRETERHKKTGRHRETETESARDKNVAFGSCLCDPSPPIWPHLVTANSAMKSSVNSSADEYSAPFIHSPPRALLLNTSAFGGMFWI